MNEGEVKDFWRVVCISDTHRFWKGALRTIPDGDILIHAGDFSDTGKKEEVVEFRREMESQPHPVKVFIAGNHDISIDKDFYSSTDGYFRFHQRMYDKNSLVNGLTPSEYSQQCIDILRSESPENMHYLQDDSYRLASASGDELHFYGSPWQPTFCDWAFNVDIPDIKPHWDRIPSDVDVLITHGPPHGILDANKSGFGCGCPVLRQQWDEGRFHPRLHVFGHIHEAYGAQEINGTVFVNASTCTYNYRPSNPAVVIDIPYDRAQSARVVSVGENFDA